jgi:hypothetical protein
MGTSVSPCLEAATAADVFVRVELVLPASAGDGTVQGLTLFHFPFNLSYLCAPHDPT